MGEARKVGQHWHSQADFSLESGLQATEEPRWRPLKALAVTVLSCDAPAAFNHPGQGRPFVGKIPLRQLRKLPGTLDRRSTVMTASPDSGLEGDDGVTSDFLPPPATSSLLGAIALVAGTTIGAGILALPAKTLEAGFAPSTAALLAAWAFMTTSGLLVAEVNVNTLCSLERNAVSISTMTQETLGPNWSRISSAVYLFKQYTLLVAYVLQGGKLFLEEFSGANSPLADLPKETAGPLLYAGLVGGALLVSPPDLVEKVNTVLFAGVIASFAALIALGSQRLDPILLTHVNVPAIVPAIPICILAISHQTVVPTICYQLGCDLPKIRQAIVAGTALPVLMFIAWNAVILGSVPFNYADLSAMTGTTFDPLDVLRAYGNTFGDTVRAFSLLAVTTSFIGFYYGLTDFFADALGFDKRIGSDAPDGEDDEAVDAAVKRSPAQKAILCALTVVPPVGFALWDPSVFFAALDNAGTYGALTLFGIIPPLMAWSLRYNDDDPRFTPDVLPGGKPLLAAMIAAASGIIGLETWERLVAMSFV